MDPNPEPGVYPNVGELSLLIPRFLKAVLEALWSWACATVFVVCKLDGVPLVLSLGLPVAWAQAPPRLSAYAPASCRLSLPLLLQLQVQGG